MDYEKAYKEALKRMKGYVKDEYGCTRLRPEHIFPELAESEDEKIRKWLIRTLKALNTAGVDIEGAYEMMLPSIAWLEKRGEQKPTDNEMIEILRAEYEKGRADAIVEMQNPAWSEEDDRLRKSCIAHIEDELERIRNDKYGHSEIISDLKESCRERINWLKSLRPQSQWKPSDEQISVLSRSLKYINIISQNYCHVLGELLAQLKKLREE